MGVRHKFFLLDLCSLSVPVENPSLLLDIAPLFGPPFFLWSFAQNFLCVFARLVKADINPFTTTEHCILVLGGVFPTKNEKCHKKGPRSNRFVTP